MKVPTDATTVFSPITSNSVLDTAQTTGFPVDAQMLFWRVSGGLIGPRMVSRLQGVATTATSSADSYLQTNLTDDRATGSNTRSWNNTGFVTPTSWASASMVYESFRRAPTFFDQVCYSGTGSNTTQTHNLNKIPELIFVKSTTAATANWAVYSSALANTEYLVLNTNAGKATGASWWNSTTPTSSVFSLGTSSTVNVGGATYVAYLFATCAGVSKVGSYTGTGTLTTIDCGFTGGARFVLIKRTDTNGEWYVWDTARGMVAGTDPSFRTNSAASEVNANSVYTIATGFQLLASPSAPVNTNGGTYIFLAIA